MMILGTSYKGSRSSPTSGLCPGCMLLAGLSPVAISPTAARPGQTEVRDPAVFPQLSHRRCHASVSGPTRIRYLGGYELLEEVGRGGMGVVYRACQISLNRTVAIKVMLNGPSANPDEVQRFRLEARAAASLQHPNIVAVHEVGEDEGVHYFSMDFVEGTNLANLVRSGPLSPERSAGYVKTIAEAIHYAHSRGIVHRDLKPANVMIDQFDQPRITDFGLAKLLNADASATRHGQVLGSPHYMSPEQQEGCCREVGLQTDIYALGAILYHLLCGRPPVRDDRIQGRKGSAPAALTPRQLNPSVPRPLAAICYKCLEKKPNRRYASAAELGAELGCFLRNQPSARGHSVWPLSWVWCRPVTRLLSPFFR